MPRFGLIEPVAPWRVSINVCKSSQPSFLHGATLLSSLILHDNNDSAMEYQTTSIRRRRYTDIILEL